VDKNYPILACFRGCSHPKAEVINAQLHDILAARNNPLSNKQQKGNLIVSLIDKQLNANPLFNTTTDKPIINTNADTIFNANNTWHIGFYNGSVYCAVSPNTRFFHPNTVTIIFRLANN
jgi:hypothetical protein